MKRFLALLLSLVLTLTLCACGGGEDTAHVGTYDCTSVTMGDVVIDTIEGSLDLQKGGKGTLTLSGETYDLTHTLSDGTLTLTIDGQDATGTFADGVITVDLFGATCTFEPSAE